MLTESINEARRQIKICNACRYCEGYCSVFPAINRERQFSQGGITQLANLCHNCRGCYYACQFVEPHEFALNLPQVLAKIRQESWQNHAVPAMAASSFHHLGGAIALVTIISFAFLLWAIELIGSTGGDGFYAVLSHNAMVAIFIPAFLFPLFSIAIGLRHYWKAVEGERLHLSHIISALGAIARMKDLSGGHGEGCNYEDEDRFSNVRRWFHQATMYGFLLCFAATSIATVMHYVFDIQAPYSLYSLPKILGLSGGVLLVVGSLGLAVLKLRADRSLGDERVWGGEMGFVLLLFFVALSGLVLYGFGDTIWLAELLALHLGAVLALFVLTPFTKMVHGFYRLAALVREAQNS